MQNHTVNLYTPENIAFGSSEIVLSTISRFFNYNVVSIIYGALPLTFCLATKGFTAALSSTCVPLENGGNGSTMLEKYDELNKLTRSINSIWAVLVLNHVMEVFLSFIWIHRDLTTGNIIGIVQFVVRAFFLIVSVLLMADGCRFVS